MDQGATKHRSLGGRRVRVRARKRERGTLLILSWQGVGKWKQVTGRQATFQKPRRTHTHNPTFSQPHPLCPPRLFTAVHTPRTAHYIPVLRYFHNLSRSHQNSNDRVRRGLHCGDPSSMSYSRYVSYFPSFFLYIPSHFWPFVSRPPFIHSLVKREMYKTPPLE